jgi:hypothetical protein
LLLLACETPVMNRSESNGCGGVDDNFLMVYPVGTNPSDRKPKSSTEQCTIHYYRVAASDPVILYSLYVSPKMYNDHNGI